MTTRRMGMVSGVAPAGAGGACARRPSVEGARGWSRLASVAALLAVACAASACGEKKDDGKISGSTFPAVEGGALSLLDAEAIAGVLDDDLPVIDTETLGSDGTWGTFVLSNTGPTLVSIDGGSFVGFVSSTVGVPVPLVGKLEAIVETARDRSLSGVTVNALTDMAAIMAAGQRLATGRSIDDTIPTANGSFSGYFGVGADVRLPFTGGVDLVNGGGAAAATLTPETVVAVATYALLLRSQSLGLASLNQYVELLAIDAADGVADGVAHAPFAGAATPITDFVGAPAAYPAQANGDPQNGPLSEALAADIEDFLNSFRNRSTLSTAAMQPLLDRLRLTEVGFIAGRNHLPGGVVLDGVPLVAAVTSAGAGTVQIDAPITVRNFKNGARVFFGNALAASVTVVDEGTIIAAVPVGVSGARYVTVINPDGKRHSRLATLP